MENARWKAAEFVGTNMRKKTGFSTFSISRLLDLAKDDDVSDDEVSEEAGKKKFVYMVSSPYSVVEQIHCKGENIAIHCHRELAYSSSSSSSSRILPVVVFYCCRHGATAWSEISLVANLTWLPVDNNYRKPSSSAFAACRDALWTLIIYSIVTCASFNEPTTSHHYIPTRRLKRTAEKTRLWLEAESAKCARGDAS